MNDIAANNIPESFIKMCKEAEKIRFSMKTDISVGSLLKTLVTSKPSANLLELGTGIGTSLSWIIEGMDINSKLITIDNDRNLIKIVNENFGHDKRVSIILDEGEKWLNNYKGKKFDLIFADTWAGKYNTLDKTLSLVKIGGLYVIDDMMAQSNWPNGHDKKVKKLIGYLENRNDFNITKLNWSSGVIIASKIF